VLRDHINYSVWGKLTSETSSSWSDDYKWTGRQQPSQLPGMQDNRGRWYQIDIHRFVSEDPASFSAGDANLYRYVHNNPTNFVDPSGLQAVTRTFPTPTEQEIRDFYTGNASTAARQRVSDYLLEVPYHLRFSADAVIGHLRGSGRDPGSQGPSVNPATTLG